MRSGDVYYHDTLCGIIVEDENGYSYQYAPGYISNKEALPISLTLPLQEKPFVSKTMIPFFDGLIPEGWLLYIAGKNWKIDPKDRMGLCLACCKDCIGAVSVTPENEGIITE